MPTELHLAETFFSIQGEGVLTGVPSFFIRTSGCNLRCHYCDTPYTSWQPRGESRDIDAVLAELASRPAVRHVVVTGGEPLIAKGIDGLLQRLRGLGMHTTVETAGTVFVDAPMSLCSITPKLRASTPDDPKWGRLHEARRQKPEVMRQLMARADAHQIKIVVGQRDELPEADALVEALGADPSRVLLMPEGTTVQRLDEVSAWLAEACTERGYRFCDRLHIRLFGNRPGT